MVRELNTATFKSEVLDESCPVLVDFHAPWCGPCQTQGPIIEKLARRLGSDVKVFKVDVDRSPELAELFAIRSVPTVVIFRDGEITHRFTGLTPGQTLVAALIAQLV